MLFRGTALLCVICFAGSPLASAKRQGKEPVVATNITCSLDRERYIVYLEPGQTYMFQTNDTKLYGNKKSCTAVYKMGPACASANVLIEGELPTETSCLTTTEINVPEGHSGSREEYCDESSLGSMTSFSSDFKLSLKSGKKEGAETNVKVTIECTDGYKPDEESDCRCGIPIDPSAEEKRKKRSDRIFGGEEASLEYPWMVKIETAFSTQMGFIISSNHIMTFNNDSFSDFASVSTDTTFEDFEGNSIDVEDDVITGASTDAVLFTMSNELDFTDGSNPLRPICLQSLTDERDFVKKRAKVAGFGITSDGSSEEYSMTLMETQIRIVDGEISQGCNDLIDDSHVDPDYHVCGIPVKKRRQSGVCKGDIGTPVMVPVKGRKIPNLMAIGMVASYGKYRERCGKKLQPSLIINRSGLDDVISGLSSEIKTCTPIPRS